MSITPDFIHTEVFNQCYEISLLEAALSACEIIESYQDPRGESCLVLGFIEDIPVHVVCGKNRSGRLILIRVYIPAMPKWRDPYTRNR